jgi:hypothetical protein
LRNTNVHYRAILSQKNLFHTHSIPFNFTFILLLLTTTTAAAATTTTSTTTTTTTVAIINGSYMYQVQSTHHQGVYIRSMEGNYIPVVQILLQMISGGDYTYKVIYNCKT